MKFRNLIFTAAILFHLTYVQKCEYPKITTPEIKIKTPNLYFSNSENTTIISNSSRKGITMECSAPYPIKWSVHGYMSDARTLRVGEPRTSFPLGGEVIYLLESWKVFTAPTILKATCAHLRNSSVASSINIIVDDNFGRIIVKNAAILGKKYLIPCLATDPMSIIQLFKLNDGVFQKIESVKYEPTSGFILSQPQTGTFKCQGPVNEVNVSIEDPYERLPYVRNATWLTNEKVLINCDSEGEINTKIVSYFENHTTIGINQYSFTLYNKTNNVSTYNCKNSKRSLTSILHYSVLDAPRLRVDNEHGNMECLSKAKNKSVSGVRCLNTNDCELLQGCFTDESCRKMKIYIAGNTGDQFCPISNYDCISIHTPFQYGLIECAVANKTRNQIFEFFTGLSRYKYLRWSDAPINHLVRMEETSAFLYANELTTFYCEAVKFIFTHSFYFKLAFSNGSEVRIHEGTDYKRTDIKEIQARIYDDLNVVFGIEIFLPENAVKLTCFLFLLTESVNISTSRHFLPVKYLSQPVIDRKETLVKIIRGTKGQLPCKSSGVPTPDVKWTKRNRVKNASKEHSYEVKETNNGETILLFTNGVEYSDAGEYVCTSVNRIGNDTVTFTVIVTESQETMLYFIICGTFAFTFLVAIIAVHLWRQKFLAENMLRELTNEEIDEFLIGNRERWLLNLTNRQDNINYMPYNHEYEIPVQKIVFDQADVLGSGAFGLVVTARLNETHVAVKSTKPAADVVYFKSLLSELKIMMFIGHHENIVKFIGCNTKNIKQRKIYIVLELCALGCLQDYIRESIHSEAKEAKQAQYENSRRVLSTELLLRWSYQIAAAMKYLAQKKIVHADLATRNVLLDENEVVKLSDFGLSLQLYKDSNYTKKQQTFLPYKWMAIESLKHLKFSSETDVWSFGVTVWEIFSFGEVPFCQESWTTDFVNRLDSGMRLALPKYCAEEIYNFAMKNCWNSDPSQRPTFSFLVDFLISKMNNINPLLPGSESATSKAMYANSCVDVNASPTSYYVPT